MRAISLEAIRQMQVVEVEEPTLTAADDVKIAVKSVGICGSDVHYYTEGRIGAAAVAFPHIVGHEFAGIVTDIGPGVSTLAVGDLVAVDPAIPCGECDQCRAGRMHTCRQCIFRSFPGQAAGALSEYVVMPARCCFKARPGTSSDQAALCEPLSVGLHAVSLYHGDLAAPKIAILGAGPIGLSVLLGARHHGATAFHVTDKLGYRCDKAAECGAGWAGSPDELDALTGGEDAFDLVFECSGDPAAIDQAFAVLKPGGTLLIVGIPTQSHLAFSVDVFRRKELTVTYVRRQNEKVQEALDVVETTDLPVEAMISHRLPFAATAEAFEMVAAYGDRVLKAMIHIDA